MYRGVSELVQESSAVFQLQGTARLDPSHFLCQVLFSTSFSTSERNPFKVGGNLLWQSNNNRRELCFSHLKLQHLFTDTLQCIVMLQIWNY